MASHGRPNDFTFGFSLRAIRFAGRLGLGFMSIPEVIDNSQAAPRGGSTNSARDNDSGGTHRNLQRTGQLDSDKSSDASGEDCREENEDTEDELDAHIEAEDYEQRSRSKQQPMAPLEHVVAHMTKLRTSTSEAYAKLSFVNQEGMVPTLAMLKGRELNVSGNGKWSRSECCHVAARYLPTDGPKLLEQMDSRVYVSQFSGDGSVFVAGFQDRRIRIYDVDQGWTIRKDVIARNLHWTVTDTALSPDRHFLIYATITPVVHLVNVGSESGGVQSLANITDIHEGLDFTMEGSSEYSIGLYSVQFSHDGREIVAGSNDNSIYVYDLEANKPVLRLEAHKDDVNTVTFADETCHLIYSGSDDHLCKVWDRRCLASKGRPAGTLYGHLEGITFIDSRGDGRYLISNGKDQAIKLWDIRKMTTSSSLSKAKAKSVPTFRWDYRWMEYPGTGKDIRHPYDQSLMTYKGHVVLRTLVRCYFSPAFTTGQKFIYTGSNDGCVYIYDLVTGKQTARLGGFHRTTVRDCSWHPSHPVLVSSSWDGCIAKWEHLHGENVQQLPRRPIARFEMEDFFDSD